MTTRDKNDSTGHLKGQVVRHLLESRLTKQRQFIFVWGWRNLLGVTTCTTSIHLSSRNDHSKNAVSGLMPNQCPFFEVYERVPRSNDSSIEANPLFQIITTMLLRHPWYSRIKDRHSGGSRLQDNKERDLLCSIFLK